MSAKEEKFLNIRPAVLACVALVCGIACAYRSFLHTSLIALIIFCLLFLSFLILFAISKDKRKRVLVILCIILISFSCGFFNAHIRIQKTQNLSFHDQRGQYVGRVYEKHSYEHGSLLYLDNVSFCDYALQGKSVAFIFNSQTVSHLDIGAVISCDGLIVNRVKNEEVDGEIFAGVYYQLNEVKNIEIIDLSADFFEMGYMKARAFLKKNMSHEASSVALAITLGDTSGFSKYQLDNYRYAGVAHVFAVSGLHVGVMIGCVTFFCSKLKIKRKFRPFFILIPAFIYCGFCGFRPSSMRAFLMAGVTILANYVGFKKDNLSSCSIAGLILLLINPFNLYDYGFKLSFLAVSSIFALSPPIIRNTQKIKYFNEPLALSLSAGLGTFPILTQMSGYTSIISLLTNLFFVPVSVVLYLSTLLIFAISALASLIFSGAGVLMKAPEFLITAVDFLISKIDFSIFAIPVKIGYLSFLWYFGLACLSDYINLKAKNKAFIFASVIVAVFGGAFLISLT